MKSILLTKLRDKNSTIGEFREATELLSTLLVDEVSDALNKQEIEVSTPLGVTKGYRVDESILLVPILRAGLVMLQPFLRFFSHARVGFLGLKRNEMTAIADFYYDNFPENIENDRVLLLDPMLATGGTAIKACKLLIDRGVKEESITGVFIVSAPEGIKALREKFPAMNIVVAHQDQKLNEECFIYPGLGDFGDRYFGTEHHE